MCQYIVQINMHVDFSKLSLCVQIGLGCVCSLRLIKCCLLIFMLVIVGVILLFLFYDVAMLMLLVNVYANVHIFLVNTMLLFLVILLICQCCQIKSCRLSSISCYCFYLCHHYVSASFINAYVIILVQYCYVNARVVVFLFILFVIC